MSDNGRSDDSNTGSEMRGNLKHVHRNYHQRNGTETNKQPD